jgi:rare lipoprotein A
MPSRLLPALAVLCLTLWVLPAHAASCKASWYGYESGNRTASGARFHPEGLTAAHRTLPFGTRLRVTWMRRSVVVIVTDRGPAKWTGRCLDLSKGAAASLGMIRAGVGTVTFTVLAKKNPAAALGRRRLP